MTISVGTLLKIVLALGALVAGAVVVRAYLAWRKDQTGLAHEKDQPSDHRDRDQ
jgi:hypothetical protein